MKITRRTLNGVWEYPLSLRDYNQNLRLRAEAIALDEVIEASYR
jgi:hypothetical protein